MLMHFSCIRTFISLFSYIDLFGDFLHVSLSLSLSLSLVTLWHLNKNPLRPKTFFILGHLLLLPPLILLLLMFDFVMIKPIRTFWRTSRDEAFIRKSKSFYQIFSILTFPLSSTVGVRSHCVESRSLVLSWLCRSFTPICTNSIIQYLILSLAFEVRAS